MSIKHDHDYEKQKNTERLEELNELLDEIAPQVESIDWDPAKDFVYDMLSIVEKWKDKTKVSEKQLNWMRKIAEDLRK